MKICPKCGKEHDKPGAFCSRSCANSRVQTSEQNESRSKKLAGRTGHVLNLGKKRSPRMECVCSVCGANYEKTIASKQKYCSNKCSKKVAGGYREGSGRAKTGYYKGIYCGSTYELAWVVYQIDHNIPFKRFDGVLEYAGKKYIPDFLQDGKIIELKGYESNESVLRKNEIARQCGYDVVVLRKDDLVKEFEWVKKNYQFKNIYELYDDYSPSHAYVCNGCGSEYLSDVKKTSKTNFCSKSCSLTSNRKRRTVRVKKGSLTKEAALAIFNDSVGSLAKIAERHNVSKNMVFFIKNKKCYSWIHE